MNEKHEMILEKTHSSGAEEWNCPTCGRRMLISWDPKFKRTILEAGSPDAAHSGFKSDLQMGSGMDSSANENSLPEGTDTPMDEARLAPWQAWLDEIDFENLWNNNDQQT